MTTLDTSARDRAASYVATHATGAASAGAPNDDALLADGEAAISLRAITKRFTPRRALRDLLRLRRAAPVTVVDAVTLDVARGGVFGILGPNGAGKTTLFRMLATLVVPDAGTALVDGRDVRGDPGGARRALASVPTDERTLNWRLSARENLRLFAALHGVPRAETAPRIAALLGTVGLESAGERLVGAFSSGMRQRLLIARALLAAPRILLLDEPTRSLDPVSALEFRRFLRAELVERRGCTILLATHNTDEAFGFCDRVAVLDRGRLLATGAAHALAARFGEERYRLVVRADAGAEAVLRSLEASGAIVRVEARPLPDARDAGWRAFECTIAGGAAGSAAVLRALADAGADVARLERADTSLAELITRIIGGSRA